MIRIRTVDAKLGVPQFKFIYVILFSIVSISSLLLLPSFECCSDHCLVDLQERTASGDDRFPRLAGSDYSEGGKKERKEAREMVEVEGIYHYPAYICTQCFTGFC